MEKRFIQHLIKHLKGLHANYYYKNIKWGKYLIHIVISHRDPRSEEESSGIVTLQKRLFGRKNIQNDPLPVVLLSYKADYDEILPPLQG